MTSQQRTSQVEPLVVFDDIIVTASAVYDDAGRYLAPPQTQYVRPDGPWRSNPRAVDRLPNIIQDRKVGER